MHQIIIFFLKLVRGLFFIFSFSINAIDEGQLNLAVDLWNNKIKEHNETTTMTYSKGKGNNSLRNPEQFTLYRNGLIGTECGVTFDTYIRNLLEFKDQYPGLFVVSHGPVNNRVVENSWLHWLKYFECLKPIIRVWGALPHAFNYEKEAKVMIQVLRHFDDNKIPVECIQTICYGFQGIICGIHALTSQEQKAKNIRVTLNIDQQEAERIIQNMQLIIVQAPMMRASDTINCILKQGMPYAIFGIQLVLIVLGALFYRHHKLNNKQMCMLSACILAMNCLKTEKLRPLFIALIMRFIMPWLSPAIASYQGNITLLLDDLQKGDFKNKFPNCSLLVTHQTCDQFVGPLSEEDQALLKAIFSKTVLIGSNEKDHLHESDEQKAVQQAIRAREGMAYNPTLLQAGKEWCRKNNIPFEYAEVAES